MAFRPTEPDDLRPATFDEEESADTRRQFVRQGVRLALLFALIVAAVYTALWWSGSAVRFGAARAADRAVPTWRVTGTVRDAVTHATIPWARVDDDPAGQPPFYRTEADQFGAFELLTLAEPHRLQISAHGYVTARVNIGRVWFLWLPRGATRQDVDLQPENQ